VTVLLDGENAWGTTKTTADFLHALYQGALRCGELADRHSAEYAAATAASRWKASDRSWISHDFGTWIARRGAGLGQSGRPAALNGRR
jgi:hypothetical protein